MNIFFIEYNGYDMAKSHCDKHVVKMIVESAQLLSTVSRYYGIEQGYKSTHINHPMTKWVMESRFNWEWLYWFSLELCNEYTFRYGRIHKTEGVIRDMYFPDYEDIGFTTPPQCMPDKYKDEDFVIGYRNYYREEKRYFARWTKRPIPNWFIE